MYIYPCALTLHLQVHHAANFVLSFLAGGNLQYMTAQAQQYGHSRTEATPFLYAIFVFHQKVFLISTVHQKVMLQYQKQIMSL